MNDNLVVFKNSDFSVRTIKEDGVIWFVAKDVAKALEYSEASNPARLFSAVPEIWSGVKRIHTRSENGVEQEREMLCISEQGLYFFLGRSDKPKALPYQMWVSGEVVPSIRISGGYSVGNDALEVKKQEIALEKAKMLQHIIDKPSFPLSEESKAVLTHDVVKILTGYEHLLMLPEVTEKWYSATDIGKIFNVSANQIGRIAKQSGLKPPEGERNEYRKEYPHLTANDLLNVETNIKVGVEIFDRYYAQKKTLRGALLKYSGGNTKYVNKVLRTVRRLGEWK